MKNIEKKNIRSISLDDLKLFLVKNEEKHYRANQVYEWLWKRGVFDFDKMTNLSLKTIDLLKKNFFVNYSIIDSKVKSKDGTKVIEPTDIQDPVMKLYSPSLLGIMNAVNNPNISIPKKQLENPNFHSGQYILKEADKFGLKKEELEYMGLTGYLESDKAKKITLEELQELIKDKPFPVFQKSLVHPDKMKEYLRLNKE